MTLVRSAAHRIVSTMKASLEGLGVRVAPLDVERWGVSVHEALASRAREFHTHHHVLELVDGADPIEALAALYHDVVYVQVDLDVPARFEQLLNRFLTAKGQGFWRIEAPTQLDAAAHDVLVIFGLQVGDELSSRSGVNEFASALVAVKELESVLSRSHRAGVAACIEATIPFRREVGEPLLARLQTLQLGVDLEQLTARAIRMANRDVGNFALEDAGHFLDNTWKLLPETNPTLHTPTVYGVRDYRIALQKMEGFLSTLVAERVFQHWRHEPAPEVHSRRVASASRNIAIAVRYLRCKLYSVSLLEALAEVTGGDAPLDYFMGGLPDVGGPPMKRLEQFLPRQSASDAVVLDPELKRLLVGGRTTPSSFDVSPSPIAAFLFTTLGEAAVMAGVEQARKWWGQVMSPQAYLQSQPRVVVVALARAAAEIADTRTPTLLALAAELERA